jgi:hypothetical protein
MVSCLGGLRGRSISRTGGGLSSDGLVGRRGRDGRRSELQLWRIDGSSVVGKNMWLSCDYLEYRIAMVLCWSLDVWS